jgi:Lrp/AsnC family transcriptional regulator
VRSVLPDCNAMPPVDWRGHPNSLVVRSGPEWVNLTRLELGSDGMIASKRCVGACGRQPADRSPFLPIRGIFISIRTVYGPLWKNLPQTRPEQMAADKDIDRFDREILRLISSDASLSLAEIAGRVGLTPTPCWKRIRRMEQDGIILRRVALLDPAKVGLPVSVFVEIETADHSSDWLTRFAKVIVQTPEIVDAWRMSGDVDYLLHVVVRDIAAYDAFYRKLIASVPLRNVSSRFSMERMKAAALPI